MYSLLNFYRFVSLSHERQRELQTEFVAWEKSHGLEGLIVLAAEGINSTVSGSSEVIEQFRHLLLSKPEFSAQEFKESVAERRPFRRLTVDIRPEIVTFGHPTAHPEQISATKLSAEQWHQAMDEAQASGRIPLILDVRNQYETALGKFRGAVDPETDVFTEFPKFLERAKVPKDQEIFMYCTGGIRCEKLTGYMLENGYQKIRQLGGGILKYLEEYPGGHFEGECFVFDHRVAVDQHLKPSTQYKLCPHCGDPGTEKISCKKCGKEAVVCNECLKQADRKSCSKNCAYHLRGGPRTTPKL